MHGIVRTMTLAVALALAAPAAQAQILPISVEGRGGLTFPTGDLARSVSPGYTVGVAAKLRFIPLVRLYGGWEYTQFEAKDGVPGLESTLTDSGFRVGGQLGIPLVGMLTGFSPYVQAGAILNQAVTRTGDDDDALGSVRIESERTLGYEVGGGASIRLGPLLAFTPEVRFRSYRPDYGDAASTRDELSYVSASFGIAAQF